MVKNRGVRRLSHLAGSSSGNQTDDGVNRFLSPEDWLTVFRSRGKIVIS